jgi:hypothetical protein
VTGVVDGGAVPAGVLDCMVREAVCGARGPDTAAPPLPHCPLPAGGEPEAVADLVPVSPAAEAMPTGVTGPTEAPLRTEAEDDGAVTAGEVNGFVGEVGGTDTVVVVVVVVVATRAWPAGLGWSKWVDQVDPYERAPSCDETTP